MVLEAWVVRVRVEGTTCAEGSSVLLSSSFWPPAYLMGVGAHILFGLFSFGDSGWVSGTDTDAQFRTMGSMESHGIRNYDPSHAFFGPGT